MFETVSTYKPRKATALTDDEISQLHDALAGLASGQAVTVSRATHDTESKARTDGLSIRKQYSAKYDIDLRTHVLGDTGEYVGAVSNPLPKTDEKTDDKPSTDKPSGPTTSPAKTGEKTGK